MNNDECPTCGAGRNEETDDLYAKLDAIRSQNAGLVRALEPVAATYKDKAGWLRCRLCCAIVEQVGRLAVCEPPCIGAIARAALSASRSLASPGALMLDPGTVEACARACEKSYRTVLEKMSHLDGEAAANFARAHAARSIRALAAPPPLQEAPGMKPGQRCTRYRHDDDDHCYSPIDAGIYKQVSEGANFMLSGERCPYVAGALQEAPTCAECKGHKGYWEAHGMCGDDDRWVPCPACAPPETERAPKCECDQHGENVCHSSADYLVTRAGKRIAVCDRCTLPGDGTEDRDLKPDWSKPRAIPAPKEPR